MIQRNVAYGGLLSTTYKLSYCAYILSTVIKPAYVLQCSHRYATPTLLSKIPLLAPCHQCLMHNVSFSLKFSLTFNNNFLENVIF